MIMLSESALRIEMSQYVIVESRPVTTRPGIRPDRGTLPRSILYRVWQEKAIFGAMPPS